MAVSSTTYKNTHTGDGSTLTFNFSFRILQAADLKVTKYTIADGTEEVLTLTSDYNVSGVDEASGGSITLTGTAPSSDYKIILTRDADYTQETDFQENSPFLADTVEDTVDKNVMLIQQIREEIDRGIFQDISASSQITFPSLSAGFLYSDGSTLSFSTSTLGSAGTGIDITSGTISTKDSEIDHDSLDNYAVGQHRTINDSGTAATDLWSADKINTELGNLDLQDVSSLTSAEETQLANIDTTTISTDQWGYLGAMSAQPLESIDINGKGDLAAPAVADEILLSDTSDSNTVKKSDLDAILALYDSKTSTLTNKTFDANGTGNSLSNVDVADLANGTDGELITWAADATPTTVAAGTASQVLTSNGAGAAPTFQDKAEQSSDTSSSTPTPTGGSKENEYCLTALEENATFAAPSGTPANGNSLLIRILDDGTSRDLSWNAIYRVVGTTLPTETTISKTLYVGAIYNSADSKWDVVSVVEEA
jgi:hypothetical protein